MPRLSPPLCDPGPAGTHMTRIDSEGRVPGREGTVDWRVRALCVGTPPETFWPDHLVGPALTKHVRYVAAVYCDRCPVKTECAAMPDKGYGGIYAGKCCGRP